MYFHFLKNKRAEILMENIIKVGDIVKANIENSPEMRVEKTLTSKVLCFWFDKHQTPHEKVFLIQDLTVKK